MAEFTGAGSGLLDAMNFRSEQEWRRSNLEQNQFQNKLLRLQADQLEAENQKKRYEASLLQSMQQSQQGVQENTTVGQDMSSIAAQNRQMGMKLQSVDPVKAKAYFDAADSYDQSAQQRIKNSLEIKAKQAEQAGELVRNIESQADWNAAIPALAEVGIQVPPQMRDWMNPNTREFVTKIGLRSPSIAKEFKDGIGFLDEVDSLAYDKQTKEIKDERQYNRSLAERLSQASVKGTSSGKIGAYEGLYSEAFVLNSNEILAGAENLAAITQGFETPKTKGMFADLDGKGMFSGTQKYFSNKVTDKDLQQYEAIVAPLVRQYSVMLNGGRPVTTEAMMDQIRKSIIVEAGQPRLVFMQKIGDMRTAYEKAIESKLASPYFKKPGTEDQKELLENNLRAIKEALPFTANEVARFSQEMKKDPSLTFKDFLARTNPEVKAKVEQQNRMDSFKVIRRK